VALTALAAGHLPFALPAFGDGTAAGTTISNTANVTYIDPNNPGVTLNATSNAVTLTVAEVAGITAVPGSWHWSRPPGRQ
jgi:hypothetical protein